MRNIEVRRYRGVIDDIVGGALTFLLELAIVIGLAVAALVVAAIVLAVV